MKTKLLPALAAAVVVAAAFLSRPASHPFFHKINQKLERHWTQIMPEKVYLQLDRTFYRPGDDLWFKAYLRNARDHTATAESDLLHVELINPRGVTMTKRTLWIPAGGAPGEFTLPTDAPGGIYKMRAYTNWMRNTGDAFEREITVQRSVLPRLKMKLDFEQQAVGPGDAVTARLDLHTLDNQALADFSFDFSVRIDGQVLDTFGAQTDTEGRAYLNFTLPPDLNSNDGLLTAQIPYRGRTESISRSIPIVLNRIDLQFLPEGGDAVAGRPGVMAFKAVDEFGKPADVTGIVYDEKGDSLTSFASFHDGMGRFEWIPEPEKSYYACLTRPAGNTQRFELPAAQPHGPQLSLIRQEEKFLFFRVASTAAADTLFLAGLSGGQLRCEEVIYLNGPPEEVKVPVKDWPVGITTFTLFKKDGAARCERLVFVNPHKKLNFEIETAQEKYLPREKVDLTVRITDERGRPVQGDFSLAVTDDNLLTFADDKQGGILAHLLLQSELKGEIEDPDFYFDPEEPKATEALDYLMLTHGWRRFEWSDVVDGKMPFAVQYPLERTRIAGRAVDSEGLPLFGLEVWLSPHGLSTRTDKSGRFSFDDQLLMHRTTLTFKGEVYRASFQVNNSQEQTYEVPRSNYKKQEYATSDDPSIRGLLRAEGTGEAIFGANLDLIQAGWIVRNDISDVEGAFALSNLTPGWYELRVQYPGYQPVLIEELEVKTGKNIDLSFALLPGRVLPEVVVKDYRVPLVQQDNTTAVRIDRQEALVLDESIEIEPPRSSEPPPPAPFVIEEVPEEQVMEEKEIEFADQAVMEEIVVQAPAADQNRPAPPPPPPPPEPRVKEIFKVVEEMPRFPGCEDLPTKEARKACANQRLLQFVYQNIEYPKIARENGVEGTVVVQFTVDRDGRLADARLARDIGANCGEEALRIVEKMNRQGITWNPGTQRGRPVKVQFNLPVKFSLNGELPRVQERPELPMRPLVNYYQAREFYAPAYDQQQTIAKNDDRTTLYWNPSVTTDKKGEARVSFYTSDLVSAFRITVEGFGDDGQVGQGVHRIYTQPAVEVDARLPALALTGDTLALPLRLVNHSRWERCGRLSVELPEGVALLSALPETICLEAGEYRNLTPRLTADRPVRKGEIILRFRGDSFGEKWQTTLEIQSRGFPVEGVSSGTERVNEFEVDLTDPIAGSPQATVTIYPNQLEELLTGMERMLRQPSGCFEQVSSSNYPNLLVLDFLRQSGQARPEIEEKAKALLADGYNRLTAYESPSGGFHWWGHDPGHEALTAYGLLQFVDMKSVVEVDDEMIRRTADWLLDRRDGEGGWQQSGRHLHSWQANGLVRNAFIVWALSEAGMGKEIEKELEAAYTAARESDDPYALALVANALLRNGDGRAGAVLDQLLTVQGQAGYWEGKDASVVCSRGPALRVETTALTALALMKAERSGAFLEKAVRFLTESRSPYGFGNTQSTVLALKALTAYAQLNVRPAGSGEVIVSVNGKEVARQAYSEQTRGKITVDGLEAFLTPGKNRVEVRFASAKEALPCDLFWRYTRRTPASSPDCPLQLQTHLAAAEATAGATVRLTTRLTNLRADVQPTPIALIGIPAGLSAQPWQLKELMEKDVMDYYEQQDGYVVLYFEALAPDEVKEINLDLKADIPGLYEAPASSAYLYYTNEHRSWSVPGRIWISE